MWTVLFFAGIMEVVWAIGLKMSNGFTRLYPSIFTVVAMSIGIYLLSVALKQLPVSTGYAVWTKIGVVGTAIVGMTSFGEACTLSKVCFLLCIVIGIIGLRFCNA